MSTVDERVVSMKFDNKDFEAKTKTTLSSLEALNKGLKLEGATKGLNDVGAAASRLSLAGIANGVTAISDRFRALSVVALATLSNIVTQAYYSGQQLVKSLTVAPIMDGLHEYETNLNSIQTILSNTQWQNTGLADVNAALQELNLYSDKTIYNFSEMARNIGTFTAAGVKLDVSVAAIKGIANLAAISGSSAEQASSAMYQLSQALATGTLKLIDWNSVVNAGMGGKVFQDALIETAKVHGVAVDKIIKDEGSFRDSLQSGWLTSQVLTETLSKFTGDLTAAQLKTMGYNEQQIAGILKMGKTAQDAATKVKTFSQLINTLQEAAGSGWAQTWQMIFGDFEEAKSLFTNVNNVLGGFITASGNARNKVLGDWKELGGRTVVIDAIANAFNALIAVITPIKDAFREIFPKTTGKQLYDLSVAIRDFAKGLIIGAETADKLKRTFAGVFAVLGIGWDVIKEIAFSLANLFGVAFKGSGSFLEVAAKVGDFLVALRQAIKDGHGLELFFGRLTNFLAPPLKLIGLLGHALAVVFDKFDPEAAAKKVTNLIGKLEPFTRLGDLISEVWTKLISVAGKVWDVFFPIAKKLGDFFAGFGKWITSGFTDLNYQDILSTINTGLFAGLIVMIKGFYDKIKGKGKIGKGLFDTIKESFEQLTNTMKTMQNTLRAATLLQIAAAIGIMTLSVVALSKIDSDGLTRALTAMSVMFIQLFTSMAVFEKISGSKGFLKLPFITGALIALAIAVDLLTIAVKNLSKLDWEGLAKGLAGLAGILAILVVTVKLMPDDKGLLLTSVALVILASAIQILVGAVTDLSGFSWEELAKGLSGVAALLVSLALFTKFAEAGKTGIFAGAGIVLLATGIKILASAMADFAKFSWVEISKGITTLALALIIIASALDTIPPTSVLSAAAVLVVATSLGMIGDALAKMGQFSWVEIAKSLVELAGALAIIAGALYLMEGALPGAAALIVVAASLKMLTDALTIMGNMDWIQIAKSLVELAGSLVIISGAMLLMDGALPGAAALLVVAASLAILAPVLKMFGDMSWEEMGKGLLMLAGVFAVLGVAGLLLTPVIPTLLGLGLAVTLLGAGMLLGGAGLLAFSIGLTALAIAGAAGAAAIIAIVSGLIGLIPQVMRQIGLGIIAFAQVIATAGPAITEAMTTVLLAIITAINTVSPKITEMLVKMLEMMLETLIKEVPKLVDAGYKILLAFLNGIANNIHKVVDAATTIIVNFLKGVADNLPKIIQSGVDLILAFIRGLTKAINDNSAAMGKAGGDLAVAIIKGMANGLTGGVGQVVAAAKGVAQSALKAAMGALGINSPSKEFEKLGMYSNQGLANGLGRYSGLVKTSAEAVANSAMDAVRNSLSNLASMLESEIDTTPTITPVLDLSNVKQNAGQLANLLANSRPFTLDDARQMANSASAGYQNNQDASTVIDGSVDPSAKVVYNQYNNSPKALSSADIYRQTKNQLSTTKGGLP